MKPNVLKVSVVVLLLAIVATDTFVSAGFLIAPSSSARQYTDSHRAFGRTVQKSKSVLPQKGEQASTAIRGGGKDGDEAELRDYGGTVAGLFGNLRIPASLIAGASLGSAFALPLMDTDNFKIGMAKRMYSLSMITTLGSMLLVVVLSTIGTSRQVAVALFVSFQTRQHNSRVPVCMHSLHCMWRYCKTPIFSSYHVFYFATVPFYCIVFRSHE
jgi:hypothetical protein